MISVDKVSVHFGSFELFNDISFVISPKDRIGLVGKNGAGKSTLLKLLVGLQSPTNGVIAKPTDLSMGYLPQELKVKDTQSVMEEARLAFNEVLELQKEVEQLGNELTNRSDYESEAYAAIVNKLAEKNDRLTLLDAANIDAVAEQTLLGLGFERTDFGRHTSEFSGGWRMRIELAKLLMQKPDVLLLDEPTNHLDIESIQWLEDFLKTYNGAVLLISHDRAFLDNVTTRTIEITLGKSFDYKVSYSKFVELRKERREQQKAAFENQQKMIEETEKFIERFRYKATKAVQVQSRIKQLEKLDRIEIDDEDTSSLNIRFQPAPRSGNMVVELKELSKSYGEHQVLKNLDLIIERGEKIAFVGRNGEGKTTLSRIIMNQLSHDGVCKVGHNVKIGYFAQNQAQLMDVSKTVFSTLDEVAVGEIRAKLRDILGAFLFGGEDIEKKVSVLSGGEKSRLALAQLLLEPYNLLILDEPTNHLDLRSKDVLKQALKNFDGTLIVVSHDRYFLNGLVDKIFEFRNKKIKEHDGDIYEFLKKKKVESFQEFEMQKKQFNQKGNKEDSKNKLDYLQRKELEKEIRKVQNKLKASEQKIEQLEEQISEMDKLLANPETMEGNDSNAVFQQYNEVKKILETEMESWEEIHLELEELESKKN